MLEGVTSNDWWVVAAIGTDEAGSRGWVGRTVVVRACFADLRAFISKFEVEFVSRSFKGSLEFVGVAYCVWSVATMATLGECNTTLCRTRRGSG